MADTHLSGPVKATGGTSSTANALAAGTYGLYTIPYSQIGPNDIATLADVGEVEGKNCATTEAMTWYGRFPNDLDPTASSTITPLIWLGSTTAGDIIEFDLTYAVIVAGTTDPAHAVAATTTGVTDSAALTIVEATHNERLTKLFVSTIAADTFTVANVNSNYIALAWTVTLTTAVQTDFVMTGAEWLYTRRNV